MAFLNADFRDFQGVPAITLYIMEREINFQQHRHIKMNSLTRIFSDNKSM